ncbi:hypothetical protein DQ356_09275 [Chryseobacterium lacus]|uniref:Uncharacterized protein n=1 Tax=Chryseobacterium lacus TaxID=2058346 RepID=A0A368MZU7_9FLAO|nr:hypothetical protein DQ356_09275 [Chryseobacterium lacus]
MSFLSCRAQTLPINTDIDEIPQGAYLKDLNNELTPYIGTYKTAYQGKEITLYITKQENKLEKSTKKTYYMDALIIKYIVKNISTGIILQDTYNLSLPHIELYSYWTLPYKNSVVFLYSGTNCRVGWGDIILKKLNPTQISWDYKPNSRVLRDGDCPGNPDLTVYLPVTKDLIFTKQ